MHAKHTLVVIARFSLPARPPQVLAFYAVSPVAEPDASVEAHRKFLAARDMVGRVYVCADGLNAQVSGSIEACADYRAFAATQFPTLSLIFKEDPIDEPAFPKLRVKHKALVPALADGQPLDLTRRGEDLTPKQWQSFLSDTATDKVVLDVRNTYEWDVGHFEGAERPTRDHFTEFDADEFGLPTDVPPAASACLPRFALPQIDSGWSVARLSTRLRAARVRSQRSGSARL